MHSVILPGLLGKPIWKAKCLVEIKHNRQFSQVVESWKCPPCQANYTKPCLAEAVSSVPQQARITSLQCCYCTNATAGLKTQKKFLGKVSYKCTPQGLIWTIKFQTIIQSHCCLKFHSHSRQLMVLSNCTQCAGRAATMPLTRSQWWEQITAK